MNKSVDTQLLKCFFTEEEKVAMAGEMAKATVEKDSLQQALKEITAQYKAKVEERETIIKKAAQLIRDGYEYRDVECDVDFNIPERGMKTITRHDTNETFVEQMTMEEKANLFCNVDKPEDEENEQ